MTSHICIRTLHACLKVVSALARLCKEGGVCTGLVRSLAESRAVRMRTVGAEGPSGHSHKLLTMNEGKQEGN